MTGDQNNPFNFETTFGKSFEYQQFYASPQAGTQQVVYPNVPHNPYGVAAWCDYVEEARLSQVQTGHQDSMATSYAKEGDRDLQQGEEFANNNVRDGTIIGDVRAEALNQLMYIGVTLKTAPKIAIALAFEDQSRVQIASGLASTVLQPGKTWDRAELGLSDYFDMSGTSQARQAGHFGINLLATALVPESEAMDIAMAARASAEVGAAARGTVDLAEAAGDSAGLTRAFDIGAQEPSAIPHGVAPVAEIAESGLGGGSVDAAAMNDPVVAEAAGMAQARISAAASGEPTGVVAPGIGVIDTVPLTGLGANGGIVANTVGADAAGGSSLADVWKMRPTARGNAIESYLAKTDYSEANGWYQVGAEDNGYFPLVDFQHGDNLVSLKSVDTNGSTWLGRMEDHIDDLGSNGAEVDDNPANMIFDLRAQPGGYNDAMPLIQYGQDRGVTVIIKEFK